jgi:hydroxylamine reductase
VSTGTKKGPGILVTGHDLLDLYELLKQTEGTGINVYTHSEMLPAHGYPELKKFLHLVGNYGGAWQKQQTEFAEFPGAILVTTSCIMPVKDAYKDRLFTRGVVGMGGCVHIKDRDFSAIIKKAKSLPALPEKAGGSLMTGFHHTAILGLADKIVEAGKAGKIKRFISPNVFKVLQDNYNLQLISTADDDLKAILGSEPSVQATPESASLLERFAAWLGLK